MEAMDKSTLDAFTSGGFAHLSGNIRLAATKMLEAFQSIKHPWNIYRWQMLSGYTSILKYEDVSVDLEDHISTLKTIMDDKKELKLYRIEAAFTLAALLNDKGLRRDEAVDCLREALRLSQKVSNEQKKYKVIVTGNAEFVLDKAEPRRMEQLISSIVKECNRCLDGINIFGQNQSLQEALDSKGIHVSASEKIHIAGFDGTFTASELDRLYTVGGEKCDCCGKSREELGQKWLQSCARCKKAHYCGRECQKKQWKAGHQKWCREPGEFKPGDFIRLGGLKSKPEYNNKMAQVVGEASNGNGRWEVKLQAGTKTISVASEKMEHLRPLK